MKSLFTYHPLYHEELQRPPERTKRGDIDQTPVIDRHAMPSSPLLLSLTLLDSNAHGTFSGPILSLHTKLWSKVATSDSDCDNMGSASDCLERDVGTPGVNDER